LNLIITGASGFLGSELALHFLNEGHRVGLLLRATSKLTRLQGREEEFYLRRCGSDQDIREFLRDFKPDVVIHTACAYGRKDEDLVAVSDANYRLGVVILQALLCLEKPVTFMNSGTVLEKNVSLYSLTKLQFADVGRFIASQSADKLQFFNLLLQHMYGPGDEPSKFPTHVLRVCQRNEPSLKLTAGEQKRDFIYIDDVVSAYAVLLKKRRKLANVVDIELGSGVASSVREFVQTVHRITASETELLFGSLPYRANEPMYLQADISYLNSLGWHPRFDLESGLLRILELDKKE
jgi:nucleoside-diphosphate-sugar epimerase